MTEHPDYQFPKNYTGLENTLKSRLYGQHLVVKAVVNHLRAHLSSTNPAKALAFTFHGGTGTGKNYVSHMIVEHIYKTGMKSKYVHFISCDREFPHASRIEQYTDRLKNMIETGVAECERAIFIFDEIDKMPIGLLDVIKPYLEHYEALNGVTYRRAMFIFLTNTAGNDISKYTLEHWKAGGNREEIELKDLEAIIATVALNTDNQEKTIFENLPPYIPVVFSWSANGHFSRPLQKPFLVDMSVKGLDRIDAFLRIWQSYLP